MRTLPVLALAASLSACSNDYLVAERAQPFDPWVAVPPAAVEPTTAPERESELPASPPGRGILGASEWTHAGLDALGPVATRAGGELIVVRDGNILANFSADGLRVWEHRLSSDEYLDIDEVRTSPTDGSIFAWGRGTYGTMFADWRAADGVKTIASAGGQDYQDSDSASFGPDGSLLYRSSYVGSFSARSGIHRILPDGTERVLTQGEPTELAYYQAVAAFAPDGDYVATAEVNGQVALEGHTLGYPEVRTLYLLKRSLEGRVRWARELPGANLRPEALRVAATGSVLLVLNAESKAVAMSFSPEGTLTWTRALGPLAAASNPLQLDLSASGEGVALLGEGLRTLVRWTPDGTRLETEPLVSASPECAGFGTGVALHPHGLVLTGRIQGKCSIGDEVFDTGGEGHGFLTLRRLPAWQGGASGSSE